ncbi:hypothetical protein D5086_020542 [Populus alba]|uniref:Uncharacterized protein n=1 Tax=Populus alba TaxID=43335 RepID=A0ACC4BKC1_POPAL
MDTFFNDPSCNSIKQNKLRDQYKLFLQINPEDDKPVAVVVPRRPCSQKQQASARFTGFSIVLLGLSSSLSNDMAFYWVVLIFFLERRPIAQVSEEISDPEDNYVVLGLIPRTVLSLRMRALLEELIHQNASDTHLGSSSRWIVLCISINKFICMAILSPDSVHGISVELMNLFPVAEMKLTA